MKKCIIVILILCLFFCACGVSEQIPEAEFTPQTSTPAPTPSPTPSPAPKPAPKVATEEFALNGTHTLPIVSLEFESYEAYSDLCYKKDKEIELPCTVTLFEDGYEMFSSPCGVSLSGRTSIWTSPKKSMNLYFRGKYGASKLYYDVFGNGLDVYDSLTLRGGSDSDNGKFTQDVWQTLALEMSDNLISQHSKFCVVYVNGRYRGIYVLKENIGRAFYANLNGIKKSSVEDCKPPNDEGSFYTDVYEFCISNDMSDEKNYAYICSVLDIDSFIDWMIIEGVSANNDLQYNARMFRSPETGNRWQFVLFDLDYATTHYPWAVALDHGGIGAANPFTVAVFESLFENVTFKETFLSRYAKVWDTVLSNEHILETIEYYEQLLDSDEIGRDRSTWYVNGDWFYRGCVHQMKARVTEIDWQKKGVTEFCKYMKIPDAERMQYFGF